MRKNEEKVQEDKKNNGKMSTKKKGEWSDDKVQLYKDNKCFFCKKPGHKLQDCRQKKAEAVNATRETHLRKCIGVLTSDKFCSIRIGFRRDLPQYKVSGKDCS